MGIRIQIQHFVLYTLAPLRVIGGFQYCERHQLVTGLYCLCGCSVFMEGSNVFLTPQIGQERFLSSVRTTGESQGSYSKVSLSLSLSVCVRVRQVV
jgi:hypothetical protein